MQPELNYNYFADDPRDLARMREAVRLCVGFVDHPDYTDIVKEIIEPTPADLESDESLNNWLDAHGLHLAAHLGNLQDGA